nr:MAG TPA: hypothetical protein [Caudoviricetes sp.]
MAGVGRSCLSFLTAPPDIFRHRDFPPAYLV